VEELENFGAYLARLGLGPEPSFFELRRAHVVSILWDNLDPYLGKPISLGRWHLEDEQSGWRFRLVEDDRQLVWQSCEDGLWRDGYGFVPEPAPLVDIEVCNWYTATYPSSPFVTGLMVCHRGIDRGLLVPSETDWPSCRTSFLAKRQQSQSWRSRTFLTSSSNASACLALRQVLTIASTLPIR
jgi:arylamine N-acetyltransferase